MSCLISMKHFIQGREIWYSDLCVEHNFPSYGKFTKTVKERHLELTLYESNPIKRNLNAEIAQVHNKRLTISIHTIQHFK
jgi:hypothetical protein